MSERIPDLMVERLALGELPEAQAQTLRARLEADGDERLAAIGRTNAEILREHPPQRVAAEIQRRLDRLEDDQRPARAGWLVWAPVAAAAGLALVWWGTRDPESGTSPEVIARVEPPPSAGSGDPSVVTPPVADDGPEAIYLKGDPQLIVDRIVEMRPVAMSDRDPVSAGDRLQVSYRAAGMAQGVIVSIDGAGVATLHFPADEGASPRLDQGGRIPLMESYELDDAPGFERFFFVTLPDDEPSLEVAQVMDAARTLASEGGREGDLRLPEGWRQQSLLLLKPQTAQGEPLGPSEEAPKTAESGILLGP